MARGCIRKRPIKKTKNGFNHTYAIVYYVDGKPKWETIGPNRKEAERVLAQRLAEVNNGTYHKAVEISFKKFALDWLENYKKSRIKPSTYRNYLSDLRNHLIPAFVNMNLSQITSVKIDRVLSKIREKRSAETVNNIRLTLHTVLDYARRHKYILENPVADTDRYKVEKIERDFLKLDEIQAFLNHTEEPFKTVFLTAILTGMRRGELLGVQWGDIDWNSSMIFVRRSLDWRYGKGSHQDEPGWPFATPKSKNSIRSIVMSPSLKKALEIHRINAPENELDLVFCNNKGKPVDPDNMVKREFEVALRFAGLRKIRFHDLRHTFVAILASESFPVKFIQRQLGHASIQTTLDTYGHLFPDIQEGAGERIDQRVFGNLTENPTQNHDRQSNYLKVKDEQSSAAIS